MGCEEVFYRKDETCSEDMDVEVNPPTGDYEHVLARRITYWPAPSKREPPSWAFDLQMEDSDLHELVSEMYTALNNNARILAAIGLRTVFDRASEKLGVDPALGFDEKLNALEQMGKIGRSERETLEVLTDAGGAAAHRGWKPTINQLDTLMTVGEQFLYRTIILEREAKALKAKIPPRQKRKK